MAQFCVFGVHAKGQSCPPDWNWNSHPLFHAMASTPKYIGEGLARKATSLRLGDLNGDGLEDAICAMSLRESFVAMLLSRGDGTYERRFRVFAGEDDLETCDAWPVDLDGDGDLDIATANARADDTTILFNDGDANFTRGERYELGDEPRSLVAGDLDGDGDNDLAFLNVLSEDVSILRNRGDGTFEDEIRVVVGGTTPRGGLNRNFAYPGPFLATGDVDGDEDLDLVVPGGLHAEILLNDGDGGFSLAPNPPVVPIILQVYDIELRDLDGDEDLDIAAALYGNSSFLCVWLNEGDGTFGGGTAYDTEAIGDGFFYYSTTVALGDIDNDGDLDAAVGNELWGAYALLRNEGDGTFSAMESQLINEGPWLQEFLDVNGDGWTDLVTVAPNFRNFSQIIAYLNDGAGTPRGVRKMESGDPEDADYNTVRPADLDGDGDLDLVLGYLANFPASIRVMENDGTGVFSESWRTLVGIFGFSNVVDLRLAHMNDDALIDLVFSMDEHISNSENPGSIWVALGRGLAFDPPIRYGFKDTSPRRIEIADIDGDGDNDVLAHVHGLWDRDDPQLVDRRMAVLLNDGEGALTIAQEVVMDTRSIGVPFGNPVVANFDGDGDLDVLGVSGSRLDPGLLGVLLNDGAGVLSLDHTTVTTAHGYSVVAGDFDGDGDPDAALMHHSVEDEIPYLTIYENDGTARFTISQEFTAQEERVHGRVFALDIDDDEDLDLVCTAEFGGAFVHLNDGRGDFSNKAWYGANSPAADFAFGDFDLDGDTDIISPRISSNSSGDLAPIVLLENVMCRCGADLDRDGVLSGEDFFLFLERYSQAHLPFCDIDHDGDCDSEDFFAYLDMFGRGC